jgi:hypothetical protein
MQADILFSQSTGAVTLRGTLLCHGYSGHGEGKNNPALEAWIKIGPIPAGLYRIARWIDHHPTKGNDVAVLAPVGHNARGRSGFLIHGDSKDHPGEASEGCPTINNPYRHQLRESGAEFMEVVP